MKIPDGYTLWDIISMIRTGAMCAAHESLINAKDKAALNEFADTLYLSLPPFEE